MAWILLEGLDRSGKSSVADMYKKKGFEIVHMEAPDPKYSKPGYSGPSYLEEIVDMYSIYSGKDTVFDRTPYGECVWPEIYNRQPLLTSEDYEYLQRLEYNNNATRILMYDENAEAHWQRCADNNEPLNRLQFVQAGRLYDDLARKYNFQKRQLHEYESDSSGSSDEVKVAGSNGVSRDIRQESNDEGNRDMLCSNHGANSFEEKLERANAIRGLLKGSIIKKKGDVYQDIESDIRGFLEKELESLFKEPRGDDFTQDEVQVLKLYVKRLKEKLG